MTALLTAGADLKARAAGGLTPLHIAITGAHDLIPELIVAGGSPQVMERVLDIGALDLPTGGSRGGGLAAGVKPQGGGIETEPTGRQGGGVSELKAQLQGVGLGRRAPQQQIAVADGVQGTGAAKGASDLVPSHGFAHMVDHDQGGSGGLAQAEQTLAQSGHGAGVVFVLIMSGVERIEHEDLGLCRPGGGKKMIQTVVSAQQMPGGGQPHPVEIMIGDQTVQTDLKGMGFEATPFLKAKLVHENQQEFIVDVEGQAIRLSREAVVGFKMLPVEDSHWILSTFELRATL